MSELYVGVMSGTSMDGVDVALCEIDKGTCLAVSSLIHPFDEALKEEILTSLEHPTTLQRIGVFDQRLGELFARAVLNLLEQESLDASAVRAIGSHGQTLWHEPVGNHPFSMQLGDPNVIAARTGITVAADFRRKDVALGGQGAPFAPLFHQFLFERLEGKTVVLNLGGMANISVLGDPLLGYDTGPGNVLMDLWISRQRGLPYDNNGEWSKSGNVDEALLALMLSEPYFYKAAPKSTGRELFNSAWLDNILLQFLLLPPADVQATLLELTVRTVIQEVKRAAPARLLVCGGGAHNVYLMQRLTQMLPEVEVKRTDEYGVSGDDLEAMLIAWLAYKRIHHEIVELKDVTGARSNAVLGGLYA